MTANRIDVGATRLADSGADLGVARSGERPGADHAGDTEHDGDVVHEAGGSTNFARSFRRRERQGVVSYRSAFGTHQSFEARRVRRIVRHVDPWSAFKLAFPLVVCSYAVSMIALVIVWSVAQSSGTVGKVESFVSQVYGNDYTINGPFLFRISALVGLIVTMALSAGALVGSIAFNLVSDLIGGVWITVIEEETARPVAAVEEQDSST